MTPQFDHDVSRPPVAERGAYNGCLALNGVCDPVLAGTRLLQRHGQQMPGRPCWPAQRLGDWADWVGFVTPQDSRPMACVSFTMRTLALVLPVLLSAHLANG